MSIDKPQSSDREDEALPQPPEAILLESEVVKGENERGYSPAYLLHLPDILTEVTNIVKEKLEGASVGILCKNQKSAKELAENKLKEGNLCKSVLEFVKEEINSDISEELNEIDSLFDTSDETDLVVFSEDQVIKVTPDQSTRNPTEMNSASQRDSSIPTVAQKCVNEKDSVSNPNALNYPVSNVTVPSDEMQLSDSSSDSLSSTSVSFYSIPSKRVAFDEVDISKEARSSALTQKCKGSVPEDRSRTILTKALTCYAVQTTENPNGPRAALLVLHNREAVRNSYLEDVVRSFSDISITYNFENQTEPEACVSQKELQDNEPVELNKTSSKFEETDLTENFNTPKTVCNETKSVRCVSVQVCESLPKEEKSTKKKYKKKSDKKDYVEIEKKIQALQRELKEQDYTIKETKEPEIAAANMKAQTTDQELPNNEQEGHSIYLDAECNERDEQSSVEFIGSDVLLGYIENAPSIEERFAPYLRERIERRRANQRSIKQKVKSKISAAFRTISKPFKKLAVRRRR